MSRMQRDKGARAEREVVDVWTAAGFPCWRTPNSGAMHYAKGDVNGVPGLHQEVKMQEKLRILEWSRQSEADCPEGLTPLLVYRCSREPWRASLLLEQFVPIYAAALTAREAA